MALITFGAKLQWDAVLKIYLLRALICKNDSAKFVNIAKYFNELYML